MKRMVLQRQTNGPMKTRLNIQPGADMARNVKAIERAQSDHLKTIHLKYNILL